MNNDRVILIVEPRKPQPNAARGSSRLLADADIVVDTEGRVLKNRDGVR